MAILEAKDIVKSYPVRRGTRRLTARGGVLDWMRGKRMPTTDVLKGINLEAEPGDIVGIIGRNGSGKSTLLKILAGVTLPSQGEVTVRGRCASLLELGAGFHPHLTGRENVYLNGGLLGVRHAQIDEVFGLIHEFSGIGDAINDPVETYSSGMYVRLAFSVAVHANPDIFLVDEVLSVGDEEFQRKCRLRIAELRDQGKTIIFVSHDLGTVSALCNRILLLKDGEMIVRNTPRDTIEYYLRLIGREGGVCSMRNGPLEAIFNHGRLTLFHGGQEVTVPPGIELDFVVHQDHQSTREADWRVTETSPSSCTVTGVLPRLAIRVHWHIELDSEDESMECTLHFECEEPVYYERCSMKILLPLMHSGFYLGNFYFEAPGIDPSQLDWQNFSPELRDTRTCLALPADGSGVKPVLIEVRERAPYGTMTAMNTDCVTSARAILCGFNTPAGEPAITPGKTHLLTVRIKPALGDDELRGYLRDWEARRVLESGNLRAVLSGRGNFALHADARPLTHGLAVHTAYCLNGIWSQSRLNMAWDAFSREGDVLRASGASTRLPMKQHWELRATGQGIAWRVEIEALEALQAQECSVGLVLDPAYTRWRTPHEAGEFPAFDSREERWRHVNSDFSPASWIAVEGEGVPPLCLSAAEEAPALRMTAVNTGYSEGGRVIQALLAPEGPAPMHFAPGRHLCFAGLIALQRPEG